MVWFLWIHQKRGSESHSVQPERTFTVWVSYSCPSGVPDTWEGLILTPLQISSRCVRDFTSFPSDGSISLLPQSHTITGTDLFGVLKQAGGAGDGSTGQPEKAARETAHVKQTHTRSTEGHQTAGRQLWTDWDFCKNKYQEHWVISNSITHTNTLQEEAYLSI